MSNCACQNIASVEFSQRLITLGDLRQKCPALSQILIPDSIWPQVQAFENSPRDAALHAPSTIIALLNGNLGKLTSPCHRFLLDGDKLKGNLSNQYKADLKEQWMLEKDEIERHRKSKMFQGRIVELQIAEWLEDQNWQITGLEALGSQSDIEGVRPLSTAASVEVKFIGQRDEEFEQVVRSLAGLPGGGIGPTHLACNFLLFRVYEAAYQLLKKSSYGIAIIAIDSLAWTFLQIPLKYKWVNWQKPEFYNLGNKWDSFIDREKKLRYHSIDSDLTKTITSLKELWIVVRGNDYTYSTHFHYLF